MSFQVYGTAHLGKPVTEQDWAGLPVAPPRTNEELWLAWHIFRNADEDDTVASIRSCVNTALVDRRRRHNLENRRTQ